MKRWKATLGLQTWRIKLIRKTERDMSDALYPGTEEEDEEGRFNAGYCQVDPHQQKAIIYVAPDKDLKEYGLVPEQILIHELLHLRLGHLAMVPASEPVGHNLLLENAIHSLTNAFLGMKVASSKKKRSRKNETRPDNNHLAQGNPDHPSPTRGKRRHRRDDSRNVA